MKKAAILIPIFIALFSSFVYADLKYTEAQMLIESKTPCSSLSDDQLAAIGEYYMDKLYYGNGREFVYRRIGDDPESLRFAQIEMARKEYCSSVNETTFMQRMDEIMRNFYGPYYVDGYAMAPYNNPSLYFETIAWIVMAFAAIFIIYWLLKSHRKNSLEILHERYEKGEISKNQFYRMRREMI